MSENSELKSQFQNLSTKHRLWTEEECRIMVNAALLKLVDDAGGMITFSVADLFKVAPKGTLAMAMSDDDKILTITRIKQDS